MKKSTISLAVAATVATSAAVHAGQYVNPGKTGQVLLFPFYNADNGNSTGIHITNTTDSVKAVKVRFLEYKNSDAVLDFNLYLSKHDHFAFGVITADGVELDLVLGRNLQFPLGAIGLGNENACHIVSLAGAYFRV
jgi:hypothetical protein